ncbi:MAG: hypothetical protein GY822_29015 [Deltaproteobacteria bacterium]|nr:hypothetical protein [Deltaproteobacteria bacterium]
MALFAAQNSVAQNFRSIFTRTSFLLCLGLMVSPGCECEEEPLDDVLCDFEVTPNGNGSPIEFPETAIREERVRSFRINNTGNTTLSDLRFEWAEQNGSHYRVALPEDGLEIRPGSSETVTIIFQPLVLSSNLGSGMTVSHASINGIGCPAYNVVVDGSSFERPSLPDGGTPEPSDGGEPDVDGGESDADGGLLDGGDFVDQDGGFWVDAGEIVVPPDAGIVLGINPQWQSRGALRVPRADFASVILDDGSVLLIGGTGENGEALASIERFNPQTGIGEVVATMELPRAFPGAVLLDDGRVLIAGGISGMQNGLALTTVEILTADFTLSCALPQAGCGLDNVEQGDGLMSVARLSPVMSVLPPNPNAKVLVAFGSIVTEEGDWELSSGGDLIEVAGTLSTSSVVDADALNPLRHFSRADRASGSFFLFGGEDASGLATDEILFFDVTQERFTVLSQHLDTPRTQGACTTLEDGSIVLMGGLDALGAPIDQVEAYTDVDTAILLTVMQDFAVPHRIQPSLTALAGDVLLYASGLPSNLNGLDADQSIRPRQDADLLVPFVDRYLRLSPDDQLASGRIGHFAARIIFEEDEDYDASDRVYFFGGHNIVPRRTAHPEVEGFSLDDNRFESGLMGEGSAMVAAPISPSGGILTVGGVDPHSGALSRRARLFDAETDSYSDTGDLSEPRRDFTVTLLDDGGNFLVVGGKDSTGATLFSASIYNPFLGTDRPLPVQLFRARSHHTATFLDDARVLICGGQEPAGAPVDSCEIFTAPEDPFDVNTYDTASFVLVAGRMGQGRVGHSATLLESGEVLLVGGGDIEREQERADLFSPVDDRVRASGMPLKARRFHTATYIGGGRVLLAGGETYFAGFGPTASVEVYERQNEVFRLVPDMARERMSPAAFLLADGRVLVAGGTRSDVNRPTRANDDSEVYAPGPTGVGEWEPVSIPLTFGRADVRGIDVFGRAMLVGGTHRDGLLGSGIEQRSPLFFVDRLVNAEP